MRVVVVEIPFLTYDSVRGPEKKGLRSNGQTPDERRNPDPFAGNPYSIEDIRGGRLNKQVFVNLEPEQLQGLCGLK